MFKRRIKNREYQSWHGYLFGGVLIIAIVLAIFQKFGEPRNGYSPIELTSFSCEASGGEWEEVCYCESDNDCPFGYSCYGCPFSYSCEDLIEGQRVCESL